MTKAPLGACDGGLEDDVDDSSEGGWAEWSELLPFSWPPLPWSTPRRAWPKFGRHRLWASAILVASFFQDVIQDTRPGPSAVQTPSGGATSGSTGEIESLAFSSRSGLYYPARRSLVEGYRQDPPIHSRRGEWGLGECLLNSVGSSLPGVQVSGYQVTTRSSPLSRERAWRGTRPVKCGGAAEGPYKPYVLVVANKVPTGTSGLQTTRLVGLVHR